MLKRMLAPLMFILMATAAHARFPGESDGRFSYSPQATTGQVTVTDVTVGTTTASSVAANSARVYWYGELISGNCTRLHFDVVTVSTTSSPYLIASSTTTAGANRRFTPNTDSLNWQGAIQLKASGSAACEVRTFEFTN